MAFFNRDKKTINPDADPSSDEEKEDVLKYSRPRICLFDFKQNEINALIDKGFNVYDGSLGVRVKIPDRTDKYTTYRCLLNKNFPPNLHEYDEIIIDLSPKEPIIYNGEDHRQTYVTGQTSSYFLSRYPQTIFDPRPYRAYLFGNNLEALLRKQTLIIIFL